MGPFDAPIRAMEAELAELGPMLYNPDPRPLAAFKALKALRGNDRAEFLLAAGARADQLGEAIQDRYGDL